MGLPVIQIVAYRAAMLFSEHDLQYLPPLKGTSPFSLQGKNLYAKDELTWNNIHWRDVTCTHLSLCFAVLLEVAAVLTYLSVLLEDWLITSHLLHTLFFITYGFL